MVGAVLDQFLRDCPEAPGVVVYGIGPDGSGAGYAAGIADPRTGRRLTPSATFRTASNTKTFAAATALRMMEQGRLTLDAPVSDFLPGDLIDRLVVVDGTSYGHDVTVRHLLTHCSGVPSLNDPDFLNRLNSEPDRVWTPWEKVEASRFDALGMRTLHVEKLEPVPDGSGPRLRHYVNGMDASGIDATCDLWGGGGLVCDARDLAEFWRALFGGQVYERPETIAEMCVTRPWPSVGWQLGMGVIRGQVCDGEVWWHTGAWGSFAVWDPRSGVTFAGMVTERSVNREARLALYDRLLEEFG